jgi:hypothetical protein
METIYKKYHIAYDNGRPIFSPIPTKPKEKIKFSSLEQKTLVTASIVVAFVLLSLNIFMVLLQFK